MENILKNFTKTKGNYKIIDDSSTYDNLVEKIMPTVFSGVEELANQVEILMK